PLVLIQAEQASPVLDTRLVSSLGQGIARLDGVVLARIGYVNVEHWRLWCWSSMLRSCLLLWSLLLDRSLLLWSGLLLRCSLLWCCLLRSGLLLRSLLLRSRGTRRGTANAQLRSTCWPCAPALRGLDLGCNANLLCLRCLVWHARTAKALPSSQRELQATVVAIAGVD